MSEEAGTFGAADAAAAAAEAPSQANGGGVPTNWQPREEVLTEDQLNQMVSGCQFNRTGDGTFLVVDARVVQPEADKPGGVLAVLKVEIAPLGSTPPTTGYNNINVLFREFLAPNEGQRKAEGIDSRNKAVFAKAVGMTPNANGRFDTNAAVLASKGKRVVANVNHRKDKNDPSRVYEELTNFRPVAG